jgi:glycolate oxidase iron-sulfur subunit
VRVGVLTGCIQDTLYRRVNDATVLTLEVNGYEVVRVPAQGCCGALHAHDGDLEGARKLARANVRAFEAAEVDFIATNAAGCGAVMKEYGELLEGDEMLGEAAERIARKSRDVTELLAERGPLPGAPLHMRVAYDAPCHLMHAQGVSEAPLEVLAAIPGLDVRVIRGADECCGGAGTYGITHPELGGRIGRDKLDAVMEVEPDGLVTGNPGCLMQIGGEGWARGRRLPGRHPVEVLAEAYRLEMVSGPGG